VINVDLFQLIGVLEGQRCLKLSK